MKKTLLFGTLFATASFVLPLAAAAPSHAQTVSANGGTPVAAPPAPASPAEQTVSLDVRDAPVRQVLIQLFDKVKVDYSLDNSVQGFVTLKVTDQPFETVLRLVLRSASVPLTYSRTGGIYEVKPRLVQAITAPPAAAVGEPTIDPAAISGGSHYTVINLTYLDPFDIAPLLGIRLVPSGSRFGNGGGGSTPGPMFGGGGTSGVLGGAGSGGGVGTMGGNGVGGRIIAGGSGGAPGAGR